MSSVLHLKKPYKNLGPAELRKLSRPTGGSQWVPHCLYDQKTYTAAGVANLTFFDRVTQDKTLCNLTQPGQLSAGNYFVPERAFITFMSAPTLTAANTQAGLMNDIERVLKVARGIVTMTVSGKPHGPIPMDMFGDVGGAEGWVSGNNTAPAIIQQATGPLNGGLPLDGELVIAPDIDFGARIDFAPAAVAISADIDIRFRLFGMLLKPVA